MIYVNIKLAKTIFITKRINAQKVVIFKDICNTGLPSKMACLEPPPAPRSAPD
jgi:hypothetical protein